MKTTKILISTILALTLFLSGCSSTHTSQDKGNEQSLDTIEVDVEADSKTILTPAPNRQTSQSEVHPHPDITIEDIYRANLRETLLVNFPVIHTSIRLSDHSQQIDMYFTQGGYFEQQTQFWPQATRQIDLLFTEKDTCQKIVFGEGEEEFSILGVFMSAQDRKRIFGSLEDYQPVRAIMLREKIILAQDMGNYIMVDTELSLDSPDDCLALRFPTDKAGYICHSIYTIEKDTLMIMEKQTILCDEEGCEEEYSTSTTKLLSQIPMAQEEMLNELESQGENNPRTITVTYDPDTSEQRSFSVTVNAGTILHYYFLPDYELFCDKQGLEPLEQIPKVGDVLIYGIPGGN